MIDPKDIASMDQSGKLLADILPSMWRGLYTGCIEQGFSEPQAMDLLKTYIRASFGVPHDDAE